MKMNTYIIVAGDLNAKNCTEGKRVVSQCIRNPHHSKTELKRHTTVQICGLPRNQNLST